jgi:hypothetical protein
MTGGVLRLVACGLRRPPVHAHGARSGSGSAAAVQAAA